MNNRQKNIVAAAALSSIAEAKAFGLKKDISNLLNADVIAVNSHIRDRTGIDLINEAHSINTSQLERYEKALDDFVYSNLRNVVDDLTLAEEVELIENTFDYSVHDFKSIPLKRQPASKAVRNMFKAIGVAGHTINTLIEDSIFKHILRAQIMKSLFDEYLILSRFELRGRRIYVLFHVGTAPYTQSEELALSQIFNQVNDGEYQPGGRAHISTCFFFTEETAHNAEPVMLFLKGINKYAKGAEVNSTTKKFFFKGVTSSLLINNNDIKEGTGIITGTDSITSGNVSAKTTATGYNFGLLYLLKADRMIDDYSARRFQ